MLKQSVIDMITSNDNFDKLCTINFNNHYWFEWYCDDVLGTSTIVLLSQFEVGRRVIFHKCHDWTKYDYHCLIGRGYLRTCHELCVMTNFKLSIEWFTSIIASQDELCAAPDDISPQAAMLMFAKYLKPHKTTVHSVIVNQIAELYPDVTDLNQYLIEKNNVRYHGTQPETSYKLDQWASDYLETMLKVAKGIGRHVDRLDGRGLPDRAFDALENDTDFEYLCSLSIKDYDWQEQVTFESSVRTDDWDYVTSPIITFLVRYPAGKKLILFNASCWNDCDYEYLACEDWQTCLELCKITNCKIDLEWLYGDDDHSHQYVALQFDGYIYSTAYPECIKDIAQIQKWLLFAATEKPNVEMLDIKYPAVNDEEYIEKLYDSLSKDIAYYESVNEFIEFANSVM